MEGRTFMVACELTPQEKRIWGFIAKAYRNQQIASVLFISEKTVEHHIFKLYEKLEVPSEVHKRVWVAMNYRGVNDDKDR